MFIIRSKAAGAPSKFRGNGIGRTNGRAHAKASHAIRASKSEASSHGNSETKKDSVPF